MLTSRITRGVSLAVVSLALGSLGAVQELQTIDAGGLKFQAPKDWKSNPPRNAMRKAEMVIPAVAGDKEPTEFAVFVFRGGAGSIQANLERWEQQFRDASGKAPKAEPKKVKGKGGAELTRVELSGTYTEPTFGQGEPKHKPGHRLLGAIIETQEMAYFLKLTGPEATIKAATPAFDKLLESVELAK